MSESAKGAKVEIMRSQLGRVRGLGASGTGPQTWMAERLAAMALIPLSLWFVYSAVHLAGLPRMGVLAWAASPVNATLLLALVAMTFRHMQMGLQVIIEDYVHQEPYRFVLLLVNRAAALLLALAAGIAVLKLAFHG